MSPRRQDTTVPASLADPRGWTVALTYARDGARRRGWARHDPISALCECGATSPTLPSSDALRGWLTTHEHTPRHDEGGTR